MRGGGEVGPLFLCWSEKGGHRLHKWVLPRASTPNTNDTASEEKSYARKSVPLQVTMLELRSIESLALKPRQHFR
jgi:hypothetical protein